METRKSVLLPTGMTFEESDAVLDFMDMHSQEKRSELLENLRSFFRALNITIGPEEKIRDLQLKEGANMFVEWDVLLGNMRKNPNVALICDTISMVMTDRTFNSKEEIAKKEMREYQEQNTAQ